MPAKTSFSDVTSDPDIAAALEEVYGDVEEIDVWVGGLAEDHLPDSSVGELFRTIIIDQFLRLRNGDRFWYENVLDADEVEEIRSTKLSDVILRNTAATRISDNVFFLGGDVNEEEAEDPEEDDSGSSSSSSSSSPESSASSDSSDSSSSEPDVIDGSSSSSSSSSSSDSSQSSSSSNSSAIDSSSSSSSSSVSSSSSSSAASEQRDDSEKNTDTPSNGSSGGSGGGRGRSPKDDEEGSSHRGMGTNEAGTVMTFLLQNLDRTDETVFTGHFAIAGSDLGDLTDQFLRTGAQFTGLTTSEYSLICRMKTFLRQEIRAERAGPLQEWIITKLAQDLKLDESTVRSVLGSDSMCPAPSPFDPTLPVF